MTERVHWGCLQLSSDQVDASCPRTRVWDRYILTPRWNILNALHNPVPLLPFELTCPAQSFFELHWPSLLLGVVVGLLLGPLLEALLSLWVLLYQAALRRGAGVGGLPPQRPLYPTQWLLWNRGVSELEGEVQSLREEVRELRLALQRARRDFEGRRRSDSELDRGSSYSPVLDPPVRAQSSASFSLVTGGGDGGFSRSSSLADSRAGVGGTESGARSVGHVAPSSSQSSAASGSTRPTLSLEEHEEICDEIGEWFLCCLRGEHGWIRRYSWRRVSLLCPGGRHARPCVLAVPIQCPTDANPRQLSSTKLWVARAWKPA